ncbi:glycosyltransferase [Olsenella sp. TM06-36]|nr:glycosyltransferase [Olsenella sp. TM06-36]RHJ96023.1 glycosyltransferase [Olsenella sp. AM05-7]RHK00543.1 glycosyltransferase [Olsenella sp. AM05-17]
MQITGPLPCHATLPASKSYTDETRLRRIRSLRQRKAVSLNITTKGICRHAEKIYQLISLEGVSQNALLDIQAQDDNGWDVPAKVFRDTPTEAVVVLVDVHSSTSSISYTIFASDGAIQEASAWFEVGEATVSLRDAKLQSRMNYRVHKDLTNRIRDYDYGHQFLFSTIFIKKAIPDRGAAIVRVAIRVPWREDGEVALRVRDQALAPVDSAPIFMGSHKFDARFSPMIKFRETVFSVRLPRDERTVIFDAWDKADPHQHTFFELANPDLDHLIYENEVLTRSADRDPYYNEWFQKQQVQPWELRLQSEVHFDNEITWSVVVPLFHTTPQQFKDLVASFRAQSYPLWELVLVDASPEDGELAEEVAAAVASDERIRSITLHKNMGITLNTAAGIRAATGDFVGFVGHDDTIEPDLFFHYTEAVNKEPETDVLYCDEDKIDPKGTHVQPFLKPQLEIDLLTCKNYISHMLAVRRSLLMSLEFDNPAFEGAQDHHLTLQAVEKARRVTHVPRVLYHWHMWETSTAASGDAKGYAQEAGMAAVRAHFDRIGVDAEVSEGERPFSYHVFHKPPATHPLVSILIPSRDHVDLLQRCIDSILGKTTYDNYEVVVIENNSELEETFSYYQHVQHENKERVRVVTWEGKGDFNYSSLINFGAKESSGDYLLLLNNDMELRTPDWLERMVGLASRKNVGAVGARLLFPDNTIQHAGVIVSGGCANHFETDLPDSDHGYWSLIECEQDLSAVTGACLMTRRELFEEMNGLDETFAVTFNDVDFCLRLRSRGLLVVYTPQVSLTHFESVSRGSDYSPEQHDRFEHEIGLMREKWPSYYAEGDPAYSPHLRTYGPLNSYWHF